MNQFEEMINLIKTIRTYIEVGKMNCNQVPVDDILSYIAGAYSLNRLDSGVAVSVFEKLLNESVAGGDVSMVCSVLDCIIIENELLTVLENERKGKESNMIESMACKVEASYYRNKERNELYRLDHKTEYKKTEFRGKGAVYTAITGNYDAVRDPAVVDKDLDYYLFTDMDGIKSDVWKVVKIDNTDQLDLTRMARKIKILGCYDYLGKYDYTIWCDGKSQIVGDVHKYIGQYSLGAPILCFNHYYNDNIFSEAEHCKILEKDSPELIDAQINRYKSEGMPEKSGMIDSCFLIRDSHSELLRKTMNDWWDEVKSGSKRDQLSFNYVCWKNGLLYDTSPLISFNNYVVKGYEHGQVEDI